MNTSLNPQPFDSSQAPIGLFSNLQTAETATRLLREAGFANERLALIPQTPEKSSPIHQTEAARSLKGGAIAGSVFGAFVGFFLTSLSPWLQTAAPGSPETLLGLTAAASGIGALTGALMALGTGVNIPKPEAVDETLTENYVLLAAGTPDELASAQALLKERGLDA